MEIENAFPAWYALLQHRVDAGWSAHLLTFMFHALRGSDEVVRRRQCRLVEEAYSRFVTWVERHPGRPSRHDRLPVWICAPDFPGGRGGRASLADVSINNGQHVHGVAVLPPSSRCGHDLAAHFAALEDRYVEPGGILRVHAAPVTHDLRRVFGYVTKAVSRGRVGPDAIIVLPRAASELNGSDSQIGRNASLYRAAMS